MARLHEDSDEDFPDLGQLMEQLTTWRNRSQVDAIVVETGQEEMQEGTRQHKNTECQTRQEVGAGEGENETAKRIRRRRPLKTFSKDLSPRPPSPKAAEGLITPPRSRFPNTPYGQSNPSTICSMTSGTYFEEGTQCTSQKGVLNGQHKSTDGIKMPTDGKENLVDGLVRCLKDDDGRIRLSSTSSYDDSGSAFLKFSPPSAISPCKTSDRAPFATPPSSPSRPTGPIPALGSPSKHSRIPPYPHRPSIDAFWSQAVINEWNDQYSPRKTPSSRHINGNTLPVEVTDTDEGGDRPTGSPRKRTPRSPLKKDTKAYEAKKAFKLEKHELAKNFLEELDDTMTGGKVASMAASAGGIRIVWSKTLSSTAGRANWKREHLSLMDGDGVNTQAAHRHIASIELAEKVIDNEDRLINVIAHEYCHLANFMISEVRDNPHGKEFKRWAKKCTDAFRHRGIEVTTKHSYTIDYKYIWECTKCGTTFKRHSRSIDPLRHTCGACKAKLVQTQPTPRTAGPSDYQLFVKKQFQPTKLNNPGIPHKDIMKLLGTAYKLSKDQLSKDPPVLTMEASATSTICNSESRVVDGLHSVGDDLDNVARKLNFFSLVES